MQITFEERALDLLRQLTGRDDAEFRPAQLDAIRALVVDRSRVLLVQRTGWGKSGVYFIATRLLREAGAGPTLLVSPLLALMRNQVEAAKRMGVRAEMFNSLNQGDWAAIHEALEADEIDVLLISAQRLANPEFRATVLLQMAKRSGMLVIDEAHCISDWGHDFVPDYRRIVRTLETLPAGVPVLCCTATANDRVVDDVAAQLQGSVAPIRGPLGRDGLELSVLHLPTQAERLAWLSTYLHRLPGSGIVYCLTIRDVQRVTEWLALNGINAVAYWGGGDANDRERAERALLGNDVKVVVATSALGMGFDKPDLGFVVHFQMPSSPIAYYQQVGRAGRQLDRSFGVLLRGAEDVDIQDWFITTAFPSQDDAETVVRLLEDADGWVKQTDIERVVNLRPTRLEHMLKVLEVEEAVERDGRSYRRTDRPWTYDTDRVAEVTRLRRSEQRQMAQYGAASTCRMEFLRRLLDDPEGAPCGCCDICTGKPAPSALDPAHVADAKQFLRSKPIEIEPRKQWPDRKAIPAGERVEPGRALAEAGDAGWGQLIKRGQEAGRFDDQIVDAAAKLVPREATWITYVPNPAVRDLAERLAATTGLALRHAVARVKDTPKQRTMRNSAHQAANVRDAFEVRDPQTGPVLLVDDVRDSGWTLTVVGAALRRAGCEAVHPLVLAFGFS